MKARYQIQLFENYRLRPFPGKSEIWTFALKSTLTIEIFFYFVCEDKNRCLGVIFDGESHSDARFCPWRHFYLQVGSSGFSGFQTLGQNLLICSNELRKVADQFSSPRCLLSAHIWFWWWVSKIWYRKPVFSVKKHGLETGWMSGFSSFRWAFRPMELVKSWWCKEQKVAPWPDDSSDNWWSR